MGSWMSVDQILDFAIGEEENAVEFYTALAGKSSQKNMKKVFLDFAEEERAHRAKLMAVRDGKTFMPSEQEVQDLKVSDYIADVSTDGVESFEDALVVAMKKEKAAYKLYTRLAEMVDAGEAKELFLSLAQEEAKHKLRFEIEYDEGLREN